MKSILLDFMPAEPVPAPTLTARDPPSPAFDRFYKYHALTALLGAYASAYPALVRIESIGKCHEGRDVWVACVSNHATGVDTDKPGFWPDGNIHAADLMARTAVLYYLLHLVSHDGATDPTRLQLTHLLDTRAL